MRQRASHALPVTVGVLLFAAALAVLRAELRAVAGPTWSADVSAAPVPRLARGAGADRAELRRAHRLRPARVRVRRHGAARRAHRRRGAPRLRHLATASASRCSRAPRCAIASIRAGASRPTSCRASSSATRSRSGWAARARRRQPGGESAAERRQLPAHGARRSPDGCCCSRRARPYVAATVVRRDAGRVSRFDAPLPPPALAGQHCWSRPSTGSSPARCSTCCCRRARSPFLPFLGAFLVAILLGLASHVPGGVGVFEGLMVLLLAPWLPSAQLLPALVVYRAVYYLLPFAVALVVLVARRGAPAARAPGARRRVARPLTEQVTPRAAGGRSRSCPAACCSSRGPRRPRRAARPGQPRAAARRHRGLALRRQRRRRRPPGAVAGPGAPARCRLLPVVAPHRRRHGGVAAEGVRLRRGGAAAAGAAGAAPRPSGLRPAGRLLRRRASRRRGWRRWRGALARRSGSGCSPSSTSTTPASCGGSSSCTARRRASSAPRSARRWWCCSSASARLMRPRAPRGGDAHRRRARRGRRASIAAQPTHRAESRLPARQGAALQRGRDGVPDVRRAGPHVGGAGRSRRAPPLPCRR